MAQKRVYVGRIHLGGNRYQWVGRYTTKRERDDAVAKKRVELERNRNVEAMSVREYAEKFLARYEREHKHSSYTTIRHRLDTFVDEFGERQLSSFRRFECREYAEREGWRVSAICTMFRAAVDDELLERNPWRGLTPQSEGRSKEKPPTDDEFARLLDACSVLGDYTPTMRALINFAAYTGMRPGEIYALEWSDIDFEHNRIFVQRRVYRGHVDVPKNGKSKRIVLTPPARDALLPLRRTSDLVFTSMRGERLSATTVRRYWREVEIKAGLEFDFYLATKHKCVHYLHADLGLAPRVIAAQMGWSLQSVLAMLEVYGHGDVGALEEIDRAFERNVVELKAVTA